MASFCYVLMAIKAFILKWSLLGFSLFTQTIYMCVCIFFNILGSLFSLKIYGSNSI